MKISRREFVRNAAASASGLCLFRASGWSAAGRSFVRQAEKRCCAVLDAGSGCVLRESLQGYQAALDGQSISLSGDAISWLGYRLVILPAIGALRSDTAESVMDLLNAGGQVLLESGAGFLGAAEFAEHKNMLQRFFEIAVGAPVDLWAERGSMPYARLNWPRELMVRDFSRAVPVSGERREIIGRIRNMPIALRKRVSNGTLIFLGSPMGPALWAGDAEALSWIQSLVVGPEGS